MIPLCVLAICLAQADPLSLPIGRPGKAQVLPGQIVNLNTDKSSSIADIAKAAEGFRFVFLGENHDQPEHHKMQAAIIEALVANGRDVIVGFEMFTRPAQSSLNPWTLGWWSEDEFVEKSDWKKQWGLDYSLYKPIFDVVKSHRLPMVALNIPRDWVRAVGRGGPSAMPSESNGEVPSLDLSNKDHRAVFDALMGGHPPMGNQGQNIYAAQVLWDTAMADSALKYLANHPTTSKTVFVVIAGSGHVMYGQGINWRVRQRTGESGLTVVMAQSDKAISVSRGLGDFVFVSLPNAVTERR